MTDHSSLPHLPEPLPQVGAVLSLDSEINPPDYRGNRHWKIAGSCVLVRPARCLAVGHVVGGRFAPPDVVRRRYAVFFPYEGFFELSNPPISWEPQVAGDNLAVVALDHQVQYCSPLPSLPPPAQARSSDKESGGALVCGYGSWPETGFGRLEGLQQQHLVNLGRRPEPVQPGWKRYDNLDLSWSSSANGNLTAGRGNSGGPFLWPDNGSRFVVGITRERQRDQQVGSWITDDRKTWLRDASNGTIPAASASPISTSWRLLTIRIERGDVVKLPIPQEATRVQATLNASQGLRLQMGIVPAADSGGLLERLQHENEASGRFLYRSFDLPKDRNFGEIAVCVCPVANARADAESVYAQLCVLFA